MAEKRAVAHLGDFPWSVRKSFNSDPGLSISCLMFEP